MYGTDQLKYTHVFWVRGTDQLNKYVLVYISWSNTYLYAYVARASWSCTHLLSTYYGSLQVTQCKLNKVPWLCSFDDEIPPPPWSLLTNRRSQLTSNKYILQGTSFLLLGCIDFLDRSTVPSAPRRIHIPLCCGIWFVSSAWSLALSTQTALTVRFCTRSSCDFVHKITQIIALLILEYTRSAIHYTYRITTSTRKAEDGLRQVLHK